MPWWGMLSAAVASVARCTAATALQPSSFNRLGSTVSTLTEPRIADRWVTITAFAVTGACGMATALALLGQQAPADDTTASAVRLIRHSAR